MPAFLSIGECMIEMAARSDGSYVKGFAGDTFNTAWYARHVLPPDCQVAYATSIGDDMESDAMEQFFVNCGIDISHVFRVNGRRPGLYLIAQQDGDRVFTYWREQSAARCLMDRIENVRAAMEAADHIFFSGITLAILEGAHRTQFLEMISEAKVAGKSVAFDPNYRPYLWTNAEAARTAIMAGASVSNIVLPSFADEKLLFGDVDPDQTISRYGSFGATEIVVKNGGGAVQVHANGENLEFVGKLIDSPVDNTGAGDSFNGAYLAARICGCTPRQAVHAGHDIAMQVIQSEGAITEVVFSAQSM